MEKNRNLYLKLKYKTSASKLSRFKKWLSRQMLIEMLNHETNTILYGSR